VGDLIGRARLPANGLPERWNRKAYAEQDDAGDRRAVIVAAGGLEEMYTEITFIGRHERNLRRERDEKGSSDRRTGNNRFAGNLGDGRCAHGGM
jgi:hypothetical protein